ncbi:MAG: uL15 family ribosomal protein [Candidatus Aenigmarchaeota archaeon]|nr:uL15 family ribosomal protein [Candidatus Aenigmarchaeota archaeon]
MTVRFKKKVRKWRGGTSHGWGMKKKHRGGGSTGGRGFAGMHKHKYTLVTTRYTDWYGRHGFHSLKKKVNVINAGDLEKISRENDIDLTKLGYGKLLSRGKVSKAFNIKVKSFTEKAKAKIEKAGGSINK